MFLLNSLRADIFKFDPNYVENEEKYKGIKADVLGEGSSDDESGSEEGDSEDDDEGMLGRLVPYLLPYRHTFQPFPKRRVLKTIPKRTWSIYAA